MFESFFFSLKGLRKIAGFVENSQTQSIGNHIKSYLSIFLSVCLFNVVMTPINRSGVYIYPELKLVQTSQMSAWGFFSLLWELLNTENSKCLCSPEGVLFSLYRTVTDFLGPSWLQSLWCLRIWGLHASCWDVNCTSTHVLGGLTQS